MRLTDLLPERFRPRPGPLAGQPDPPVRQVRLHSPESIAAAAGTEGTLANRVLKGLFTGQPLVVPAEQQDFVDYLGRQLTKQLLDSEKRGAFQLRQGTTSGLPERWGRQPVTLLDSPDVREGHAVIVRQKPKEVRALLPTIADPDRNIPWTVVIHPSQWDVAVMGLELHGCDVLNRDAPFTPHHE